MRMAEELAKLSNAERQKVGSLVVKDTQIISEGYNGTPAGFDNACAFSSPSPYYDHVGHIRTKSEVLHAESNAITKLARSTNSSSESTLYVTLAPCYDCAKLIIQAGIKRVVYKNEYVNNGLVLLDRANISVSKMITNETKQPRAKNSP
jgi:dCMP deaminase